MICGSRDAYVTQFIFGLGIDVANAFADGAIIVSKVCMGRGGRLPVRSREFEPCNTHGQEAFVVGRNWLVHFHSTVHQPATILSPCSDLKRRRTRPCQKARSGL